MNEFDFIKRLREQAASRQHSARVITGIGDDAAVITQLVDRDLVVTTDLLIEEIDFHRHATPPRLLGHKALAVSLSDIAAMGARPFWSFLSIGMPQAVWDNAGGKGAESSFKDDFIAGFLDLADKYGVTLAGGDISESKQGIIIDSIVLGEVASGSAVTRSGARAGDQIYVTGNLGGAAAGLKLIELGARVGQESGVGSRESGVGGRESGVRSQDSVPPASGSEPPAIAGGSRGSSQTDRSDEDAIQSLLLRQLGPQPRVGWGIVLGEKQLATAMIDISDGLSSDLHHLCAESHAGATIDAASIPINEEVKQLCGRRALDPLALALHGGEDFELLFTVRPENASRMPRRVDGVTISKIGEITSDVGKIRVAEKSQLWELQPEGFRHF